MIGLAYSLSVWFNFSFPSNSCAEPTPQHQPITTTEGHTFLAGLDDLLPGHVRALVLQNVVSSAGRERNFMVPASRNISQSRAGRVIADPVHGAGDGHGEEMPIDRGLSCDEITIYCQLYYSFACERIAKLHQALILVHT